MNYTVVVLRNDEVFGTWVLDFNPNHEQRVTIKHAIRAKIEEMNADESMDEITDTFVVNFEEQLCCDTLGELIQGITDSIENEY